MVTTLFMDLNTTSFSLFSAILSAVLLTNGEILYKNMSLADTINEPLPCSSSTFELLQLGRLYR